MSCKYDGVTELTIGVSTIILPSFSPNFVSKFVKSSTCSVYVFNILTMNLDTKFGQKDIENGKKMALHTDVGVNTHSLLFIPQIILCSDWSMNMQLNKQMQLNFNCT